MILASTGLSHGNGDASLCLWDMLLPPSQALVASCAAHGDGGCCLVHCAANASLVTGGNSGDMAVFDLRQRRIRKRWRAHSKAVQAITVAESTFCFSASVDSDLMLWDLDALQADGRHSFDNNANENGKPLCHWPCAHESHALFTPFVGTKPGDVGINAIELTSNPPSLLTGGSDGKVKLWRLRGVADR